VTIQERYKTMPNDREIQERIDEAMRIGDVEVAGVDENGQTTYRMTAQGTAKVEADMRARGIDPDDVKRMGFAEFARRMGMDGSS
jgi:hypothetical protein